MTKQTLTELFANSKIAFTENEGREELRALAERFSLETTLSEDGTELTFGTEDQQFTIRHDLNEELEVVFEGTIHTYCPQRLEYSTGYMMSASNALDALIAHCKSKLKTKDKSRK